MNEEEEFEFRLRFEQEQGSPGISEQINPEDAESGFMAGVRDPLYAASQLIYNLLPEESTGAMPGRKNVRDIENWISEKFGLSKPIPEEGYDKLIQEREAEIQAGRKAEGDEGVDWDRLLGNVVSTAVPGIGAAKLAAPTTMMGKTALGAGSGAGYGALTPATSDDFWQEKAEQTGTGAVIGALVPGGTELLKAGGRRLRDIARPITEGGITKDVESFINKQAGAQRDDIIDALSKAKTGETPAQSIVKAQQPGKDFGGQFVKLEDELSKLSETGSKIKSTYSGQEAGRQKIIDAIAGTPEDLTKAKSLRGATSTKNYTEAYNQAIKADPKLLAIVENPYAKKALPTAIDLAKANAVDPKENLTQFLHYVKIGIDKQLQKSGDDALSATEIKSANDVKNKLVNWIGQKNPAYEKARSEFAEQSVPINQMEVGKTLKEALISPKEEETLGRFLTAMRDAPKTLKKSTGFKRYEKLDEVLTPEQMKGVNKVAEDLVNKAKQSKMARESEGILKSLSSEETRLPRVLSQPVVITNHILSMIGKNKAPEYQRVLTDIMTDPDRIVEILRKGAPGERKIIDDILQQLSIFGGVKTSQPLEIDIEG